MAGIDRTCEECDGTGEHVYEAEDGSDELTGLDTCPACRGKGIIDPRLDDRTTCAVCYRRYSWGCGHSAEQESAALDHEDSAEHREGRCLHFDHRGCDPETCRHANERVPGYAPFVHHRDAAEWFAKVES